MCPNYKPAFEKHLRQKTGNSFNYEHLKRADEMQLPRVALENLSIPAAPLLPAGQNGGPIGTGRGLKRGFWGRARWSRKVQDQLLYLTRWLALWFQFYRPATEQ